MNKNILQAVVKHVARHAAKKEVLIGIDPQSTLGQDILRQNAEIMDLKSEVIQLKKMVADLSNHLKETVYSSPKSSSKASLKR